MAISFYGKKNFRGSEKQLEIFGDEVKCYNVDRDANDSFPFCKMIKDNKSKSVAINPGCSVYLYDGKNHSGEYVKSDFNIPELSVVDFDKKTSSFDLLCTGSFETTDNECMEADMRTDTGIKHGVTIKTNKCENKPEQNFILNMVNGSLFNPQINNNNKCVAIKNYTPVVDNQLAFDSCSSVNMYNTWTYDDVNKKIVSRADPTLCISKSENKNNNNLVLKKCEEASPFVVKMEKNNITLYKQNSNSRTIYYVSMGIFAVLTVIVLIVFFVWMKKFDNKTLSESQTESQTDSQTEIGFLAKILSYLRNLFQSKQQTNKELVNEKYDGNRGNNLKGDEEQEGGYISMAKKLVNDKKYVLTSDNIE